MTSSVSNYTNIANTAMNAMPKSSGNSSVFGTNSYTNSIFDMFGSTNNNVFISTSSSNSTEQIIGNVLKSVLKDVIKAVLGGDNQSGNITDAKNDEQKIATDVNSENTEVTTTDNEANQIVSDAENAGEQYQVEIEDGTATITDLVTGTETIIEDFTETVGELREQLQANQEQIAKDQEQMDVLAQQIEAKKQEIQGDFDGAETQKPPTPPTTSTGESAPHAGNKNSVSGAGQTLATQNGDGSPVEQLSLQMTDEGIDDPELKELIDQYNSLGQEVASLQATNLTITTTILTTYTAANDEANANMDEAEGQIENLEDTEVAAEETQINAENDLNNEQSKLNTETTVKDTNNAGNITQEGVDGAVYTAEGTALETAASTVGGITSVFDGGSTKEKLETAGNNDTKAGGTGTSGAANNGAVHAMVEAYLASTIGNIAGLNSDLSGLFNELSSIALENIDSGTQQIEETKAGVDGMQDVLPDEIQIDQNNPTGEEVA